MAEGHLNGMALITSTLVKDFPTFKMPKGEIYAVLRVARRTGIYLVMIMSSWRWKIPPDFNNLQPLAQILRGVKVADIVTILGSVDIIMGSVEIRGVGVERSSPHSPLLPDSDLSA